jgi:diguanylate cyclase (GGDEF)-like protein
MVLSSALTTAMIALSLLFAYRPYAGRLDLAMRLWTRGTLGIALAWLLLGLRDRVPDAVSIVAGNTLLCLGFADYVRALRVFSGFGGRPALPYGLVAVATALAVVFTYVVPSLHWRTATLSIVFALLTALLGAAAWRVREGPRARSQWLMVAIGASGVVVLAGRALSLLLSPGSLPFVFASSPLQAAVYGYGAIAPLIATFAFMLMCNDRINADLVRSASSDALTGIMNRRAIQALAGRLLAGAHRQGRPLSLLLIDADHFKRINDAYGHAAGDLALKHLVHTLSLGLRGGDHIGRLGGEEFVVLMEDTRLEDARQAAERLRERVAQTPLRHEAAELALEVSIGLASAAPGDDVDALLRRADRALYAAKHQGRNRVVSLDAGANTDDRTGAA